MDSSVVVRVSSPSIVIGTPVVLRGPNPWALHPIIALEIEFVSDGDHAEACRALLQRFSLLSTMPCTSHHKPAIGDCLTGHASIAGLLEHLLVALQVAAGSHVRFSQNEPGMWPGRYLLALEFEYEEVALQSVNELKGLLMRHPTSAKPEALALRRMRAALRRARRAPIQEAVIRAARERDIPVRSTPARPLQLGYGRHLHRIQGLPSDVTRITAARVARDPVFSLGILGAAGIPTPVAVPVQTVEEAVVVAEQLAYPVSLSYLAANNGSPASRISIANAAALRSSWANQPPAKHSVLVTRWSPHPLYSVLVAGTVICSVSRLGSGRPRRSVRQDDALLVTMHATNREDCVHAARELHLPIALLTVQSPDLAVPFRKNGGVITAVEGDPDLSDVSEHSAASVGCAIVESLYRDHGCSRVPVFGVTGTNGKTTTTRLLTHLLRLRFPTIGVRTTDDVRIGDQIVLRGDINSYAAGTLLVASVLVDAVALELTHGCILSHGLPVDRLDVGVVLNVSSDHLETSSVLRTVEDLARVKSTVAKSVSPHGCAVLNADDSLVYSMKSSVTGEVMLFLARERRENVLAAEHNGRLVSVEDGWFTAWRNDVSIPVAQVTEVPMTLGGRSAVQVANASAAIAAAWAAGGSIEDIRAGLLSFTSSPSTNPGRMNLLDACGVLVLVDYAHNAASLEALQSFARSLDVNRRILLVGLPGDRRDADLRECGRIAAGFDRVIVRERDRPGPRGRDEVAHVIREGLAAGGISSGCVETVLSEREAVDHALASANRGDLVVLLVSDVSGALAQVEARGTS